jgi:hypothetical protein
VTTFVSAAALHEGKVRSMSRTCERRIRGYVAGGIADLHQASDDTSYCPFFPFIRRPFQPGDQELDGRELR